MDIVQRIRWSGLAAMIGGLLCGVHGMLVVVHSSADGSYLIYGLVLIVVGLVGLNVQHAGRARRSGRAAVVLAIVGVALLAFGGIAGWLFFALGFLAILGGLLLFGIAALRAGVLPRWASVLIFLTPILFYLFYSEDSRAWLLVPFGAAWVALGYLLWSGKYDERHPLGGP